MTGYYIELGYQSGYSADFDLDEAWKEMKTVCGEICSRPERIADEAVRLGAPVEDDGAEIYTYAQSYHNCSDLTIKIVEKEKDGEKRRYIQQFASGGNPCRMMKEHLRRAFCRLMMEEMHKRGIEINISVG